MTPKPHYFAPTCSTVDLTTQVMELILQALYDYYLRKTADPDPARRRRWLEDKEIPFIHRLIADQRALGITPAKQGDGKRKSLSAIWCPRASSARPAWQPICFGIPPNTCWASIRAASRSRLPSSMRPFVVHCRFAGIGAAECQAIQALERSASMAA